jgi:hypothetical protein
VRIQRVITDNGPACVSHAFRDSCKVLRIRDLRTKPYTPGPTAKQNASSKPAYASGPTQSLTPP